MIPNYAMALINALAGAKGPKPTVVPARSNIAALKLCHFIPN